MQLSEQLKTANLKFPINTCHPGGSVKRKPAEKPLVWECGICGKTHLTDEAASR